MIEPSNTDLGDTPDSVREYLEALEETIQQKEEKLQELQAYIQQIKFTAQQNGVNQPMRNVIDQSPSISLNKHNSIIASHSYKQGWNDSSNNLGLMSDNCEHYIQKTFGEAPKTNKRNLFEELKTSLNEAKDIAQNNSYRGLNITPTSEILARILNQPNCIYYQLSLFDNDSAKKQFKTWEEESSIFSFQYEGETYYPSYLFDDDIQPIPLIQDILKILSNLNNIQILIWFENHTGWLDGKSPKELFQDKEYIEEKQRDLLLKAAEMEVSKECHG